MGTLGQANLEAYNKNRKELETIQEVYNNIADRLALMKKCIDNSKTFFNPLVFPESGSRGQDKAHTWYKIIRPNAKSLPPWPYEFAYPVKQASIGECVKYGLNSTKI